MKTQKEIGVKLWDGYKAFQKAWKYIKVLVPVLLICIVFLLGAMGLAAEQHSARYISCTGTEKASILHTVLTMFVMNYSDFSSNAYVVWAKWLATVFTLYVIIVAAWNHIAAVLMYLLRWIWKDFFVLVVGENAYASALCESLKLRGIGRKWQNVPKHSKIVLMGSDEENLQYLQEHALLQTQPSSTEPRVFVRNDKMNGVISQSGSVKFFSLEEIAARKYWKDYPVVENLTEDTFASTADFNIAIIGEGKLLEELLLFGTQMNIYGESFRVHYTIYGNNQSFESTHDQFDRLGIRFFQGEWWHDNAGKECLKGSDRIIILDQSNPYQVFSAVLRIAPAVKVIHIFSGETFGEPDDRSEAPDTRSVWQRIIQDDRGMAYQGTLVLYDWIRESCTADLISNRAVYDAIGCSEVYQAIFPSSGGSPWNETETYLKYSNLFSADFAAKYEPLVLKASPDGKKEINQDYLLQKYVILEHIRWCNYNYYFNWKYGTTATGRKDKAARIHPDLVDYHALPHMEKMKDKNSVIWLLVRDDMPKDIHKLAAALSTHPVIQEMKKL